MALIAVGLSTQIYNNHVKSFFLLLGFPLLLLSMLGFFFGALAFLSQQQFGYAHTNWAEIADYTIYGIKTYGNWALGITVCWFIIAYFFHGRLIRKASGSHPVTRQEYPKLYNLLENLCISRGMRVPSFEIIESSALNAFSCGINNKSYKIVVTRGLLDALKEDELEAVLAHELTHIINRDVRVLVIAVIFVGMISFFAEVLARLWLNPRIVRGGRRSGSNGLQAMIAMVVLWVGYLFALLIRFALSRKREYLADAGAIELTKNPDALMRALIRIDGHDEIAAMNSMIHPMCIEHRSTWSLFSTHPSIRNRLKMISAMTHTPIPQ